MPGIPRVNARGKGFWEGGARGHGRDSESSGQNSGFPGSWRPRRPGVVTDIEFPPEDFPNDDEARRGGE